MAKYTPKPYVRGRADDSDYDDNQERFTVGPKPRRPQPPRYDLAGERIRPLPRGFSRGSCVWYVGIGWVFNPTRKVLR